MSTPSGTDTVKALEAPKSLDGVVRAPPRSSVLPAGYHKVPDLQGYMPAGETLLADGQQNAYSLEADDISVHELPCGFTGHKHVSKVTNDGWFYCPEEKSDRP